MPVKLNYLLYPFAASAQELPGFLFETASTVVASSGELKEKLLKVLKNIVERGEVPTEVFKDPEESVLVYRAIVDVAGSLGDKRLISRIALAYSKTSSRFLKDERDEVLVALANRLGLRVKLEYVHPPCLPVVVERKRGTTIEFVPCTFAVPLLDYVKVVAQRLLHDPSYMLVNNIVHGGYVFLDKRVFRRILEEYIYQYLQQECERVKPLSTEEYARLLGELKPIIGAIYSSTKEATSVSLEVRGEASTGVLVERFLPPCIRRIMDIVNSGGNPSHIERFNLAAFLGNLNLSVDEVLEYFRKTADFKERVARYQVEHILGLRGGRKKYKPYNCDNMRATGLCPVSEQCPGGKNPLAVYKYNLRKAKRCPEGSGEGREVHEAAGGI